MLHLFLGDTPNESLTHRLGRKGVIKGRRDVLSTIGLPENLFSDTGVFVNSSGDLEYNRSSGDILRLKEANSTIQMLGFSF